MDLNFIRLVFTVTLEADCGDPYLLFGLKPFFLEALRLAASCRHEPCARGEGCPYHQLTAQDLSDDQAALKRFQKPSYPFVFDVPLIPALPNSGRSVELGITLAGRAINHVDVLIAAVTSLLKAPLFHQRFRATVTRLESVGYDGDRVMIRSSPGNSARGQAVTLSLRGLQETAIIPADSVAVTIITPMRLMTGGRPVKEFSFSSFIRALLRRLSSVAYYHGGDETELDYKWLSERSRSVETVTADFRWTEQGSRWCGLLGTGRFAGLPVDFHPFLLAGEYLHVGKGASFGLGAYRIIKTA